MEKTTIGEAFDKFKPESCVFVLSVDKQGKPGGMIAGWSMRCSLDPPLYAVSLQKQGYTHELIRQSREFVIAVPNKELEEALLFFGSTHSNEVDKFSETGVRTALAKKVRTPLLTDATLNFECELLNEVDAGDHLLFIGTVVAAHINQNKKVLMNMKKVDDKRIFEEF